MEMRGVDEELGTPYSSSSTKLPNSDSRRDHTVPHLNFTNLHHYLHKNTKDRPETTTPDPVHAPSPSSVTPPFTRSVSRTPLATVDGSVQYRECLKNHAASSGGHVLDGCGEFMPNGEDGTLEALKCAACGCHRNFHRRDVKDHEPLQQHQQQPLPNGFLVNGHRTDRAPVPLSSHHHQLPAVVPISSRMMAFGGSNGDPDDSSSEDLNMYYQSSNGGRDLFGQQPQSMKKRHRTKFTREQKEKMEELAEKLGWRIQKHDELEVQQFCTDVGVKRQVFKVWMHNNKQAMKNKQT